MPAFMRRAISSAEYSALRSRSTSKSTYMPKPPRRKSLSPPGKCIFCGTYGLTKTHIWPEWLGRLLPFGDAHEQAHISRTAPSATEDRSETAFRRRRQGCVFSLKPFIAYKDCNTGWMARFEAEMVKFSKPIFTANDHVQIHVFSVWLSLITVLAEHLFKDNIVISKTNSRLHWATSPFLLKSGRTSDIGYRIATKAHGLSQLWPISGGFFYPFTKGFAKFPAKIIPMTTRLKLFLTSFYERMGSYSVVC